MNPLSLLSAMLGTALWIGGLYCVTRNRKQILNVFSFFVLFCLGWWNLCYAFFFSASSEAELWLWHRLGALGWTGFVAVTTYYFIVLTGTHEKMKKGWMQLLFYALPTALLLHNLFGQPTSLAMGFVKSEIGGQWTYRNAAGNGWLWAFLLCLVVYFGLSFFLLLRWSSQVKHRLKRRMAVAFVILDALTILLGFVTDVLLPLTRPALPAMANLCTALFGAGYFLIIIRFDLFNVHLVVSDREIIAHSMEAILVTDETGEILDCNRAGAELFAAERSGLIGGAFFAYLDSPKAVEMLRALPGLTDEVSGVESPMHTRRGEQKQLLLSAAAIRDRQREYLGTVVSLRDITQISLLKERYRLKCDEYETLAFKDTLTGLPNRRKTFEELARRAEAYDRDGTDFFVLYLDLDHFKAVNDLYGHDVGDRFLTAITARLGECVCEELDFLGRLSGDEFLMIGGPDTAEETLRACMNRVRERFAGEFVIGWRHIQSDVSVGCARYSDFGNIDAAVHHADEKMYTVKQKSHTRAGREPRGGSK